MRNERIRRENASAPVASLVPGDDRSPYRATSFRTRVCLLALLTACSGTTSEPAEGRPAVVVLANTTLGEHDVNEYAPSCIVGPESPSTLSTTCPVLRWAGHDYWPLSFTDNRSSMAIHSYDATGKLHNVRELVGARYAYRIDVDEAAETVTFRGQTDRTVVLTWEELRQLR